MKSLIITNKKYKNDWIELSDPRQLPKFLEINRPERLYFPFWSWKIHYEITERFLCIGFHVGKLPEDEGGSPIQNLIRRGDSHTDLNAFLINDEIDGGKVIDKRTVCLNGSLEEILIRIGYEIEDMINVRENNK